MQRAGMSGGGETDWRVWAEFCDAEAGEIRDGELEREFGRLWRGGGEVATVPADADDDALQTRAKKLGLTPN
jgi:hypothetical protein